MGEPVPQPLSTPPSDASATSRRVLVFANPYSGSGPNRRHVDALAAALRERGLEVEIVWRPEERAVALAACGGGEAACRCVVAAGGDGSIADAVNEMARHGLLGKVPLATLPVGTENLFAREFGFTLDASRLADAVAAGRTRQVDLGAAGGRLFTLMASAGFDAEVVHRMAKWRCGGAADRNGGGAAPLKRVTRLSYLPRILGCVREYAYPPVTVEIDGQRHTGAHLFVFNLPQYGGNLGIARHACGHDAQLDWVLFQRPGVLRLADYGLNVILGARHLKRPDVLHGRATRLRITSDRPIPLQADGDPAGFTPIDVEVRPCALTIVAA